MNEHLQNLARRAGFVGTNFSNTVIGTDQETALENFAELLVQECADIAKHIVMNISTYADADYVDDRIKQHFGVK